MCLESTPLRSPSGHPSGELFGPGSIASNTADPGCSAICVEQVLVGVSPRQLQICLEYQPCKFAAWRLPSFEQGSAHWVS